MLGPAFVAAIAYVDPGNFATNVQGGAKFGYLLLWVVLAANLMAMLIQYLSAKLGIVTESNLPELCRDALPPPGERRALASGRGDGDVDRHRRVPRRRARPQPPLPRPALSRRRHHGLHRLRHPRAAAARLPPLRARHRRAARDHLPRLPVRDAEDRPVGVGVAARHVHPAPGGRQLALPRGRDHRRDGHAARDLPPLGAHAGPHAGAQRRRALARAPLRAARRHRRARLRRPHQHGDARRRREALPHARALRPEHDPAGAHASSATSSAARRRSPSRSRCSRPARRRRASARTRARSSWPAS